MFGSLGFSRAMRAREKMVMTGIGPITEEIFYTQRDSRMRVHGRPAVSYPVAIVLPPSAAEGPGAHLALLLAASMVRRMGRAFSRTILVAPPAVASEAGRFGAPDGQRLEEQLLNELVRADPFGDFEWRSPSPQSFGEVQIAIWLGGYEDFGAPAPPGGHVACDAHGWVVRLESPAASEHMPPRSGHSLFAAPAATAMAVALAVAQVAGRATGAVSGNEEEPTRMWYALDDGRATFHEAGEKWFLRGGASSEFPPWSDSCGSPPPLSGLALVSAGGVGLNAAHLLAASHLTWERACVIDPDIVDVSNLNRLFGVGVLDVGKPKAELATEALRGKDSHVKSALSRYEEWATSGGVGSYLGARDAVLIGVDQVTTRLEAAADWPALMINAATSGTGWTVSMHRPGIRGCLGCYYALARLPYGLARGAVHCGAAGGAVDSAASERAPDASFPFSSVAAAAMMVASLIQAAWRAEGGDFDSSAGELRRMNTLVPIRGESRTVARTEACRLLCSHEGVAEVLGRRRQQFAPALPRHKRPL